MKTFKDFMTEAPTFQPAENPAAAGFADPAVIMKINALMGQIIKEDQVDSMGAVAQIRSSLSKLGLTFDEVKPFTEDKGEIKGIEVNSGEIKVPRKVPGPPKTRPGPEV